MKNWESTTYCYCIQ